MVGVLKYILFILVGLSQMNRSLQKSLSEKKRILDQLFQNYDSGLRPSGINGTDGPVLVHVNLAIMSITSISDYDMEYAIQLHFRQEWIDERLKFEDNDNSQYISFADPARIWKPDIFILNEKDSHIHKLMVPNVFFRVYPSGLVLHSTRVSATLGCYMQLERFPFDTQVCTMKMESYGFTQSDLRLLWREANPVQVFGNTNIMGFTMKKVLTSTCDSKIDTGSYSCLRTEFFFSRDVKYYVLHTFLPSTVLVVVSWTSFWMDRQTVVARILLVLSTLFAMSSLATDIEASVPHVPYVKAMDLWVGACFTFLLAALVEFAVVNATSHTEVEASPSEVRNEDGSTTVDMKPLVRKSTDSSQPPCKPTSHSESFFYRGLLNKVPRDPSRIDAIARVLFPTTFFIFIIVYFFAYNIFDSPRRLE